jgi:hypothetical protein
VVVVGGGGLAADTERLLYAACGVDALAAELVSGDITSVVAGFDSGDGGLDEALGGFAADWVKGLEGIVESHYAVAEGLRAAVSAYLRTDALAAYVALVMTEGFPGKAWPEACGPSGGPGESVYVGDD